MQTDNVQVFTEQATTLYKEWIDRLLIIASLLCHIILVIVSPQRKYNPKLWVKVFVWVAYMLGAWMATIVLGNLAGNQRNSRNGCLKPRDILQAFWAPFLLMHLGGADTITAYSLHDYELFYRNVLAFVFRVGVAIYIFIWSWGDTILTFLAVPMFIIGIIKYGERWVALWLSRTKVHFPDNRSEFEEGSHFDIVYKGYSLFKKFTLLYDNQILNCHDRKESYEIIHDVESAKNAFTMISVELGLMFDVLYTKSAVFRSKFGRIFRCLNFIFFVSALVVFWTFIDYTVYPLVDIWGTVILLAGAIVLEVFTLILVLFSDWTTIVYPRLVERLHKKFILRCMHGLPRWSKSMGQYNLLDFCLNHRQIINISAEEKKSFKKFVDKNLQKYLYLTREPIDENHLQDLIFQQLKEKSLKIKDVYNDKLCKKLLAQRGDSVLKKENLISSTPDHGHGSRWWTTEVAFNHSLLIWHIATTLCYYSDGGDTRKDADICDPENSKCCSIQLSRYMLYLRVNNPSMLPDGIDEVSYIATCNDLKNFFQEHLNANKDINEACQKLLEEETPENRGLSVLQEGRKLAGKLQSLECPARKWKIISEVWTEMLTYAANRCAWREHGLELNAGGELLTLVRLLMVHLGLSEQYTTCDGHDCEHTP